MAENKPMPRTEEEKILFDMWREVLGRDDFGIDDDFFGLGGTSLTALDIISRLSDRYSIDLRQVFEEATIRSIAATMVYSPEWAEDKLKVIFQKHEKIRPDKDELRAYRKKMRKDKAVRRDTPAYSTILILGATGFLGAYLLRELLDKTDCRLIAITRAENDSSAARRINDMQLFYFGTLSENSGRLTCFAGDLTREHLGLSEEKYTYIADNAEAVLNSAAMVKHMGRSSDFSSVNTGMLRSLVTLANTGRKKAVHHISSIGILYGDQTDSRRTTFTEYDLDIGQRLDNNYLISKLGAEKLLLSSDAECSIYRVDGVMFDSIRGTFQKNMNESSAYIFLRALDTLRFLPDVGEYRVRISMVDEIASAVVRLMLYGECSRQVYHVIHPKEIRFSSLLGKLVKEKNFRRMDAEEICRYYRENTDKDDIRSAFGEILLNCEIFESIMKNRCSIRCEKTVRALRKTGFRWKRIRRKHIEQAYSYVRKTDFLNTKGSNEDV